MWACFERFEPELYNRKATICLDVRMLMAEVIDTLLYGCVTCTLGAEHFAKLRTVHYEVFLRVMGLQFRQRAEYTTLSYAKALKKDAMREHRNDYP